MGFGLGDGKNRKTRLASHNPHENDLYPSWVVRHSCLSRSRKIDYFTTEKWFWTNYVDSYIYVYIIYALTGKRSQSRLHALIYQTNKNNNKQAFGCDQDVFKIWQKTDVWNENTDTIIIRLDLLDLTSSLFVHRR